MSNHFLNALVGFILCFFVVTGGDVFGQADGAMYWPTFCHDISHTGSTDVNFLSENFSVVWTFSPSGHVWAYRRGVTVWSSPIIAMAGGKVMLFVGCYDHSVYALDAKTGKKIWRFTTGDVVNSTPTIGEVNGVPMLFVGSTDRSVYALDARNGKRVWVFETMPWSYTVSPSQMSSPIVLAVKGSTTRGAFQKIVLIGVWNNNRSGFKNVQRGELYIFNAADGSVIWKESLSTTPILSPAVANIAGNLVIYVASQDGNVHALGLMLSNLPITDGKLSNHISVDKMWRFTANEFIYSSPSIGLVDGSPTLFFGTRFHSLYALDARSGKKIWRYRAGYWIDSTPAIAALVGDPLVFIGSHDRNIYAIDARIGREVWRYTTENAVYSSAAIAKIKGRATVFISSLDNHLYIIDGASKRLIWKFNTGKLLWSHIQKGDCILSSPAIAIVDGRPMLFVASYNGKVYAFANEQ